MRARVAHRERDRVAAVALDQRHQPAFDLGVGLVPADLDEAAAASDQRGTVAGYELESERDSLSRYITSGTT